MTGGGNRGRALLRAQRHPTARGVLLDPLTEGPPAWLDADGRQMWEAIIAATAARLAACDAIMLAMTAKEVAYWRRHGGSLGQLRFLYRCLGDFFVPMRERRRLLLPDGPHHR